jgi:hypothetical protein
MEQVCRVCKSARLLRSTQVLAFGGFLGSSYPVGIQGPMTSYKGNVRATVSASVCVDCGDVQLQANRLDKLQRTYVALQGDPALRLNL